MLKDIFRRSRGHYHALNRLEISASTLLHNYHHLSHLNKQPIFPVLKSNAYGHGIIEVARILDPLKAPFVCVDSIFEAYQLLKAKIVTPILIMGYVHPETLNVKKLPFSYAVYCPELLAAIHEYQPHAGVHLFVDTGMHREGIPLVKLRDFVLKCKSNNIRIEGLMSHLAMADKPSNKDTMNQVQSFEKALKIVNKMGVDPQWIHLGASSFILKRDKYSTQIVNSARAGIALYGIDPGNKSKMLKPAAKLISTIVQIKNIQKGDKVGYDFTYTAKKNQVIAVLPLGYNDGVNRRLSNKGFVLVKGVRCPIFGKVSMNITVIDITKVQNATIGDEAIVYSDNPNDKNSIINSAKVCKTIPYELLVYLNASTKRIGMK